MESTVNERVKKILRDKKISISSLSRDLNMPNASLRDQINNENYLKVSTILSIIQKFPEISIDWLLLGEGDSTKIIQQKIENENKNGVFCNNHVGNGNKITLPVEDIKEIHLSYHNLLRKKDEQLDNSQNQINMLIGIIDKK